MHATSREVTVVLVTQLRELAISQGWPFEYTDRIGETYERIYQSVEDPEIRALAVSVGVRVGADYNRWDVMRIAGRLIQLACGDEDARAIAHALEPLEGDRRVLTEGDYVNPKTLHPAPSNPRII